METQHARDDDYVYAYVRRHTRALTQPFAHALKRAIPPRRGGLPRGFEPGPAMAGQGWEGIGYLEEKKYKYAHEKRINALNLEPPSKLIDLPRRLPPRGAATTRNFRAALEEIDRKMKGMVISRSVEALGRAIDEEQKTEQRMLRPGTGSAAPSTEHRTGASTYVGVRTR